MQLLACKLIRKHFCGKFVIPMDFKERENFNNNSHFGDQPASFTTFNKFFCKYIGGSIQLVFQGLDTSREEKTCSLISSGWFVFVSSCYMRWNYFSYYQKQSNINRNLNMCGSCWKCKIDIDMILNSERLNKEINLCNR